LVLSSLNGRKPQLLIDPNVDLARQPRGFVHRTWVLPQSEPLPAEPWNVPLLEWERNVALPLMPFLNRGRPPSSAEHPRCGRPRADRCQPR
jgi:hypothetical protein